MYVICHDRFALFEQAKIMRAAIGKGRSNDLHGFLVDNHLCFLGVTLLFAAVVSFLLFFGRSMGCSAFLPGKRNSPERTNASSTLLIVRQTVASRMP